MFSCKLIGFREISFVNSFWPRFTAVIYIQQITCTLWHYREHVRILLKFDLVTYDTNSTLTTPLSPNRNETLPLKKTTPVRRLNRQPPPFQHNAVLFLLFCNHKTAYCACMFVYLQIRARISPEPVANTPPV